MRTLRLLAARLVIIIMGILSAWIIVRIFIDADKRAPWFISLLVTYVIAAYVIVPWVVRTSMRLLRKGVVATYSTTADGLPGDPVNLALVGTLTQLRAAFQKIGWTEADTLTARSAVRMARAFTLRESYPAAPFSTLYLFGRGQDIGLQKQIGDSPRKRDHVRFWGMSLEKAQENLGQEAFWRPSEAPGAEEVALWVGAATRDIGFSFTKYTFQVTHATDANTNAERDFVIGELINSDIISNIRHYQPGERITIGKVNRYVTDGYVTVANLISISAPPP